MRISFYTIDDLRLGHDPKGVTGWRLSQFLNWRERSGCDPGSTGCPDG